MSVPQAARTGPVAALRNWAGRTRILSLTGTPLLAALGAILAGFIAGVLGLTFYLGFWVGEKEVFPAGLMSKVERKLDDMFGRSGPPPKVAIDEIPSALVRLRAEVGIVPFGRTAQNSLAETGGGLTSFGGEVLVLPYTGELYSAGGPDTIRKTKIVAPDNNRAAYVALDTDPAFDDYRFVTSYLRYNDLLYFQNEDGHGLIASYTEYHPEEACVTNTLARLDFPAGATSIDEIEAAAADWRVLFRTRPCLELKMRHLALEGHMAGGRLAFRAPSTVYLTSGDFHMDGMRSEGLGIAQDPAMEYGKVLAVDIRTGAHRMVSYGHRNAQGIAFARDGGLYVVEHGPRGGDELNRIREGANYGWPKESYGTTYQGGRLPEAETYGRHDTFEPPVFSWVPSVATASMTVADGFHESWDGDLIIGSLGERSLHRVRLQDGQPVYAEPIRVGTRVRDVHQHTDGRLVIWSDNEELIFLTAEERRPQSDVLANFLENRSNASAAVKRQVETAVTRCAECHSFEPGDHRNAPGLRRIFGDRIASTGFEGYSDALKGKGGRWTADTLAAYLDDPQGFAPGTTMPDASLGDPRVIEEIVDYLDYVDRLF